MKRLELSVVIPVFNEESRVSKSLEGTFRYLKAKKITAEILIVDDGSKDKTIQVVEKFKHQVTHRLALRVLKHEVNRGKGAAVRTGVLSAKGEIILYMDADNATPLTEYENFRPVLKEGWDVVIGSRAIDRKKVQIHQPLYREAMGRIFNLLVQLIATPSLWDTQCGFKAFKRKAALDIFPLQTIERFGFDVELLYIARKLGYSILEAPVRWFDAPGSKVNMVKDSTRMAFELFLIRWNDLKGRYSPRKIS
jgi:dolichyl-phosphate beta-glucosyltransferase